MALQPNSTTTVADPLIGAIVAERYRIESFIGRGGMGVVYKVEHAKIGKVMALKLLTGELARNRETVQRFKREALLVSKLSHPNTVQVFDYGSSGGLTYLAMEYLNGQDLGQLIESQGPRPFSQMAKIAVQACGALREAHDKRMVHRDIKPENIFLTKTPTGEDIVKVLDFGLAKLRESKELNAITSSGHIVGTPYYMSPEQVRGEDVDGRADIYSLCALLYTSITGYYVFDAPNPVGVLTQQVTATPTPPHERAPDLDIPLSVSNLILKGLQKDPRMRFQSAEELEDALMGELQGTSFTRLSLPESGAFAKVEVEEETATRDEVEKYERTLRRRERFTLSASAALLVGACVVLVYFFVQAQRPPEFAGREMEPNHEVAQATAIPFGVSVAGRLGKRIAPGRGDQDNFQVQIPAAEGQSRSLVNLNLTALPNMPICAWIFQAGRQAPLHRYCSGKPGRGIALPHLSVAPGPYLIVVQQDTDAYQEGEEPLLYENVSDDYELSLRPAERSPEDEIEPNNELPLVVAPGSIQPKLSLDGESSVLKGQLNVMRDVDVVCATGTVKAQFVVVDAAGGSRPLSAALQVTPHNGPQDKIPVRIHGGRSGFVATERDSTSPWRSSVVDLSDNPCLELKLVPNPLAPLPHPLEPPSSDHEWSVKLVPAPAPTKTVE
jgi:serine/threonine-protein kinase